MAGNLKEIAKLAGVSLATASRVLSGSSYAVSRELRDRVLAAASEMDYIPNAQARALITGSGHMIGMLVGEVGDPYFDAMIHGAHRVASAEGALVTIVSTGRDTDRELDGFRQLQSHGASVIVVAGSGLDDSAYRQGLQARIRSFSSTGKTVVMGRHDLEPGTEVIRIEADNVGAGRALGEQLRELGHTRVGVLSGDARVSSTSDRLEGLRAGLEATPTVLEVPQTRDGGYEGTGRLIRRHDDLTAIVGTADQMAIGALSYCADNGIDVPKDLSVAGCNDIWVGRDLVPGLTTVHIPLEQMGEAAMRLALSDAKEGSQVFGVQLVVRASTGPVSSTD